VSTISYIVRLVRYLAKSIPIISSSLELFFDRFSKKSFNTNNTKDLPIWLRNNTIRSPIIYISDTYTNSLVPFTESIENNSLNENLFFSVFLRESLVVSHYLF